MGPRQGSKVWMTSDPQFLTLLAFDHTHYIIYKDMDRFVRSPLQSNFAHYARLLIGAICCGDGPLEDMLSKV